MNFTVESNEYVFALVFNSIKDARDAAIVMMKAYITEVYQEGCYVFFPLDGKRH